jgi:hypothetical protein
MAKAPWALATAICVAASGCSSDSRPEAVATPLSGGATASAPSPTVIVFAMSSCPLRSTVVAALGLSSLGAPSLGGVGALPQGASGIACTYQASPSTVVITIVQNVGVAYLAQAEATLAAQSHVDMNLRLMSISGIGDECYAFNHNVGATSVSGILAQAGPRFVEIVATLTRAPEQQLKDLVRRLL